MYTYTIKSKSIGLEPVQTFIDEVISTIELAPHFLKEGDMLHSNECIPYNRKIIEVSRKLEI